MQVTRTFLDKTTTICGKDNKYVNLSLNPIMEINCGKMLTRGLLHFDHTKVKQMVEDKTYPEIDKFTHTLHMTNCSSIEHRGVNKYFDDSELHSLRKRAASFDLIFFLIPNEWDDGRGFDFTQDLYYESNRTCSTDCVNWVQYKNHFNWDEEGVYTTEHLSREVELFTTPGKTSQIVFDIVHFEYGIEDIELDITTIFNKFITGELENYGIGIAFAPTYEWLEMDTSDYVGFFTPHTHSFFEPYVETRYDEIIVDNRNNFCLDKPNRLYFYTCVDGNFVNLDTLPTCIVNDEIQEVKQATKGMYYVEVEYSSSDYEPDCMFYDVWSELWYEGRHIPDVELEFVTKAATNYYSFGLPQKTTDNSTTKFSPTVTGLNSHEQITQGGIKKVNIECHIPYTTQQVYSVDGIEYRIYVENAEKQQTVIDWTPVERGYNENYFLLRTDEFVPFRYFLDLRIFRNQELTYHNKAIEFDIVSDTLHSAK